MQAALAPFWLAIPRSTVRGMIADARWRRRVNQLSQLSSHMFRDISTIYSPKITIPPVSRYKNIGCEDLTTRSQRLA